MTYISNAFSLGMIDLDHLDLLVDRVSPEQVFKGAISCVGHADTAALISSILGWEVPMARVSVSLNKGDVMFVAQYNGPRLPEGATSLPEGATLRWYRVVASVLV